MKNKKILTIFAGVILSTCCITGCEKNDKDDSQEIAINSLYDGFVALYQTKNYSFDVIHTYGTYREEIPNMIFTKDYIGFDGAYEDFDVLYNDSVGIYRVAFDDDFVSGEYLLDQAGNKYTSLWDSSVVYTMYGVGGKYIKKNIKEDTTSINIDDKDYKLAFLKTIVGNTNGYANVDKLEAKYENNKVTFELVTDSGLHTYKIVLKDVGNTKSTHLKSFINNGGKPLEVSNDLSEMRRLLKTDNYVQRTYMVSGNDSYWSGFQFFHPHYFFTTGNDSSVGNAYMEFNYKETEELDNDFDMWGIYLVNVGKNENNEIQASLASSIAYNSSTVEIEECCNYPSRKLDILKNLEYVKVGELTDAQYDKTEEFFENGSNKYYFMDEGLVANFCENFSLIKMFEDVIWNTVGIEIGLAANDKDSMICFHAIGYYPLDSQVYDIIIPLYGFGDANRSALDILYEQYNNVK